MMQIVRRAGIDQVKANDVILVLSDPDLELEAEKAEWQLKQEQANLANLKVKLESDKLDQRASLASLESQYTQAKLIGGSGFRADPAKSEKRSGFETFGGPGEPAAEPRGPAEAASGYCRRGHQGADRTPRKWWLKVHEPRTI